VAGRENRESNADYLGDMEVGGRRDRDMLLDMIKTVRACSIDHDPFNMAAYDDQAQAVQARGGEAGYDLVGRLFTSMGDYRHLRRSQGNCHLVLEMWLKDRVNRVKRYSSKGPRFAEILKIP